MLKTKKRARFFTSLPPKHEIMKANLSQKAMKLAPTTTTQLQHTTHNYFTEEQHIYVTPNVNNCLM